MAFHTIVFLAAAVLLLFMLYKEWRRPNKAYLIWRLLASITAILALVALVLPIKYTVQETRTGHTLHLLTAGVTAQSISAIKGDKFYTDSAVIKAHPGLKANYLPDLNYYLQSHPDLKTIYLYGYGLSKEELSQLKGYTVNFESSPAPSGVVACNWQPVLHTTVPLWVQGSYQNKTKAPVKLLLLGLGNQLDSTIIKAGTTSAFAFRAQPQQSGRAVYQVVAVQQKDTLSKDLIPFVVAEKLPINVLVLAAFPDFEYKFFKKWLFENQYPVALRNRISKDKYSTDFLNRKAVKLDQIDQEALKGVDVLVADEAELLALSPRERTAIQLHVTNGMGLLVRLIDPKGSNPFQSFNKYEIPNVPEQPSAFKLAENNRLLPVLPMVQQLFLRPSANAQSLVVDAQGKVVVSRQLMGMGQIVGSTLSATYQWELAGKQKDYAAFWSMLLAKTTRPQHSGQNLLIVPPFNAVGEQTRFIVNMATNQPPHILFNGQRLSPRQNMELPFEWDVVAWPKQAGWHAFTINQQPVPFYIYQSSDWQVLKSVHKINDTQLWVNSQAKAPQKEQENLLVAKEVSKWWFLAIFLLSCSFLWYELRLLANK